MWLIYLVVLCIFLVWYYNRTCYVWSRQGVKQTKPWLFLGDSWVLVFQVMSFADMANKIYYMHPNTRYTGFYQFRNAVLMIKDPELIKQLTIKDFDYFTDHRSIGTNDEFEPEFNKNLFFLKGQKWREMRALLSGSFTSSKMKTMYNLIAESSENFVNYFCNKNEDQIEVELKDIFSRYTNDVIASTSFGIKVDSLTEPNNEFYLMGKQITNFNNIKALFRILVFLAAPALARLNNRFYEQQEGTAMGNPLSLLLANLFMSKFETKAKDEFSYFLKFLNITIFSKTASKFFSNIIKQTIKLREEQNIVRSDMIHVLLEVKKGGVRHEDSNVIDSGFAVVEESQHIVKHSKKHIELTELDIIAQAMIFFLAGFDTVSTAMSNCCYELAVNPDIQNKLREEIKNTMEEHDGKMNYEATLKMKYLDMVVSETLRKYPGLTGTERVCVKPYTIEPTNPDEKAIRLNPGDLFFIPMYSLQHDPQYYPEPEKFLPERFSEENKHDINPYTYVPFGIGPRACIGSRFALLEMKTILIQLVNKFEIIPTKKTQIPMELSKSTTSVVSRNGYSFAFKRIT